VHVAGVVLIAAVVLVLISWDDASWAQALTWNQMVREVADVSKSIVRNLEDTEAKVAVAISIVGMELGYAALAWLFIAWDARSQRILTDFARTLRRLWLFTPHLALPIAMALGVEVGLGRARYAWWLSHRDLSWRDAPWLLHNDECVMVAAMRFWDWIKIETAQNVAWRLRLHSTGSIKTVAHGNNTKKSVCVPGGVV
jgi:hypothetical protein